MLSQPSLKVTWEGYSVTDLPAFYPPGLFTNMELAVLAREVSKVTRVPCKKNLFSGRGPGVSADYSVSETHVVAGGLNFPIWVAGRCRAALHSATSRLPDLCAIQHGSQVWGFGQTSRHVEGGASHLRAGTLSGQAISFSPSWKVSVLLLEIVCNLFRGLREPA